MDVYVGRQPIFDHKMRVYGYELLYRRSENNWFEGLDDNQATAELISNAFLAMQFNELTHGTKAFINFSADLLIREIPLLLPKDFLVIEILERVELTPEVINACKSLKKHGYVLALDDFVFEEAYQPLIELADIVKLEFGSLIEKKQQQLFIKYKNRKRFLAEKIETRESYRLTGKLGFNLFQGFFFSKPVIVTGKQIQSLNNNLIQIINELNADEPKYQTITGIVERDLGLSYKLFKIANSIAFGTRYRVQSIKQALVRIGIVELKKWVYLLLLKENQSIDNNELIKNSLVRGKLMEMLALQIGLKQKRLSFFVSGLFSSIDILLNRDMRAIVAELPLPLDVTEALLGVQNEIRQMLDCVLMYEVGDWRSLENSGFFSQISRKNFMKLYIDVLRWSMDVH